MVSRIVDCNVKPERLREFRDTLANDFLPQLEQQPGFVDLVESVDPETGHFVCMTLWRTHEDIERYDRGLFQEIAQRLVPLMSGEPAVHTMQVENSTAHRIARTQAA